MGMGYYQSLRSDRSRSLFRSLFSQFQDAYFMIDPQSGAILDVNEKACKNLGYKREELIGLHVYEIEARIPTQKSWQNYVDRLRKSESITLKGAQKRKNGSVLPVENYAKCFQFKDVELIIAIVRDLTFHRQIEDTLLEIEREFRTIFDHSNDAIFILDPEQGVVLDANPRACDLLGYSYDELVSANIEDIHPSPEMETFRSFAVSVLEHGHGWSDKLGCTTKGGRKLHCEISASAIDVAGTRCILALVRSAEKG